jgi:hypothetical protein
MLLFLFCFAPDEIQYNQAGFLCALFVTSIVCVCVCVCVCVRRVSMFFSRGASPQDFLQYDGLMRCLETSAL